MFLSKINIGIHLGLTLFAGCIAGSKDNQAFAPQTDWQCMESICIRVSKQNGEANESPAFSIEFKNENPAKGSLTLNQLDERSVNDFRFHFDKYVYFVNKKDTIYANFSHLEETAGVKPNLIQMVGFDSIPDDLSSQTMIVVDSFFTNRHFSISF